MFLLHCNCHCFYDTESFAGHIDHSARVMRVITWNRSFRGIPNGDGVKDEDSDDFETHATVLDKLLAWEKKLYDEVKVCLCISLFHLICLLLHVDTVLSFCIHECC